MSARPLPGSGFARYYPFSVTESRANFLKNHSIPKCAFLEEMWWQRLPYVCNDGLSLLVCSVKAVVKVGYSRWAVERHSICHTNPRTSHLITELI